MIIRKEKTDRRSRGESLAQDSQPREVVSCAIFFIGR